MSNDRVKVTFERPDGTVISIDCGEWMDLDHILINAIYPGPERLLGDFIMRVQVIPR